MSHLPRALRTDLAALRRQCLAPVDVAVVDSGIDATHPALRRRVAAAWRAIPRGHTARMARVHLPRNNDVVGHGTSVGGIVAAIAPKARLLDVRVLDARCLGGGPALLAGLEQAIAAEARLINLSLACVAQYAPQLHELCERAYRRNLAEGGSAVAKKLDPRAFLREKLGAAGLAKFEEGMRIAAKAKAEGREHLRLGHVATGVDARKSHAIIEAFHRFLAQDCAACWLWRLCRICFIGPTVGHGYDRARARRICEAHRADMTEMLQAYATILEANPSALDCFLDTPAPPAERP